MDLKVILKLSVILFAVIIRCELVATEAKSGYVTMSFTPYNKNRKTIGIGGYLNGSPRRPRKNRNRFRGHHHHHNDHYPEPYEDEYYDNQGSGSDRCNCKTKYVAIEVPKGSRKDRQRYRYRESNQQQYIAVPVESVSMNEENGEEMADKKSDPSIEEE